ncbi:hypothetical protein AB1Y20_016300 [Prymnesium parvum]|uniref:Uncharacterized protein n=1 Tax=Prymnesium parvum TaxID=97485 RepID=A0AB34IFL6_PRYPA|mmetsp:Transcript_37710/g.93724  ORF Transcript_37710/g.93724 Transcript_37710/m.93724 type:complete len:111 (-) Transcript_37710:131-463(-)
MINFTNADENVQARRRLSRRVTSWVEELLPREYADCIVMVNEMQCFEPGCAPLETVVSLLGSGQHSESRVFKIFKPLRELEKDEVSEAVRQALSGNTGAQHLASAAPPTS